MSLRSDSCRAHVLRRAIRLGQDRDDFLERAVHDRSWWINRDDLFRLLTPAELGLANNEPYRLLLLANPDEDDCPRARTNLWRTLFHAEIDRRFDERLSDAGVATDRTGSFLA